jgi:hypothetical protein
MIIEKQKVSVKNQKAGQQCARALASWAAQRALRVNGTGIVRWSPFAVPRGGVTS